ncbi:MAG: M23 family metallopeptidase [Oscillospiraceae bacterium]|nr:M23 family metallopeptidase [Oscillospiraceae bacterium]
MKQANSKTHKVKHFSFYLVMLLCMVMVSIACWFAYTQTKNQLVLELDSAVNSINNNDIEVMEMETAIPRTTIPATEFEPELESETKPETFITQPVASVQQLQTAPTETQPITQPVIIIDAPETAPIIITEIQQDITETTTIAFTSSKPACYPLQGEIIEPFSNGELVKSATTGVWQSHNGIDIAGTLGDTVCAMDSGVVQNIENHALWGVTVTIDHQNGIYSRYCNLNTGLTVNAGDKVEAGTVIGALGDTADIESALETHLHFEVLRGEIYIDPVAYIGDTQTTENTQITEITETTTAESAD